MRRRLSNWTIFFYGFGHETDGIKDGAFAVLLLFYYQQVVGLSGTLTGVAIAIALAADAITDPVAGSFSDRLQHRWGRRHPMMIAAMLPLAITFIALFNPPTLSSEIATFLWLTVFAIGVRLSLTIYQIPLLALGADLATHPVDRANLFNIAAIARSGGTAVISLVAYPVFFKTTESYSPGTLNPEAYLPFSVFFAFWMVVIMAVSTAGTFHELPYLRYTRIKAEVKQSLFAGYQTLLVAFRATAFRILFVFLLAVSLIGAFNNVFGPYVAFHFWEFKTEQLALIVASAIPGIFVAVFLAPWLAARFEKKTILIGSTLTLLVVNNWAICARLMGLSWFPDNGSDAIFAFALFNTAITGVLLPIVVSTADSMLADVSDELSVTLRESVEGVVFSSRAFVLKAATSLGVILGGISLDLIEFPTNALVGDVSADVVWELGFVSGPVPAILNVFAMLLLMGYPLSKAKHVQVENAMRVLRQEVNHGA